MKSTDKELVKIQGLYEYLSSFLTARRIELIKQVLAERTRHLTVVLEDIFHPPNASAVIRSCECFGIQEINIIENEKTFRANTEVVKGSAKWVDLNRFNAPAHNNTEACIKSLKDNNYSIIAMTLREGPMVSLDDIPVDKKLAICLGCEETGLSEKMHEAADYYVKLPMYGFTDSFNISVSAALALQTLTQKLRRSQTQWRLSEAEKTELRMRWTRRSIKRSAKIIERFLAQRDL